MNDALVLGGSDQRLSKLFEVLTAEDGEGYPPFRWQKRLLKRLVDEDIPQAVDVPTGLGKTSVMALWLIALAEGAKLPRRLVYVVDRRAVVDQATRFAERLKRSLPVDLAHKLGFDDSDGVPISTLRGGFADNRDWLEDPSKPAIIVGTVDMIGSRLLFEGYGVSRKMRPYHAGLLGVDALIMLDEAHLCPPFEFLLRQVAEHRDGKLGPKAPQLFATPPFHLMSLSATGRDGKGASSASVFKLEDQDCEESEVLRRLYASKRLGITELASARLFAENLADRAVELGDREDGASRVLICCNSRRDAVDVKARIDKECQRRRRAGERVGNHASELLVGERRVYERAKLEDWLEAHGFLGGADSRISAPTFLVATSAGEVGVDLDADHLVCDLVAYERMVQRLGRVNRRGGEGRTATVDVFWAKPELKAKATKADREKYASHVDRIERHLAPLRALRRDEDGRHDVSPAALVTLKADHLELVKEATTPVSLHPALGRPLLDAWSMTSLERHEGRPEVAPWLRGWQEDEPQTVVVWRRHLPSVRVDGEASAPASMVSDFFRSAPVHATEKLEAESGRVFDWLLKRVTQVAKRQEESGIAVGNSEISALVLDPAGDCIETASFGQLREFAKPAKELDKAKVRERDRKKRDWKERLLPGRTLIVDTRIGGLMDGMLDEKSQLGVPTADVDESWQAQMENESAERPRPQIKFRVRQVFANDQDEGLNPPPKMLGWRHVHTFETALQADGTAVGGLAVLKWHDDAEDDDSRSILSAAQRLRDHAEQVAEWAHQIASRLNMHKDEIKALTVAARLHDDGKAAKRWQTAMNAPTEDGPYAKTEGGGNPRLLDGYRHEFGSLLKAEQEELPVETRDLILHLVAAHHGNARPLISFEGCEDGPPSQLEAKAGDAALRFARLQNEYGPWGLAWREAILRAADQSASRAWSRQNEGGRRG